MFANLQNPFFKKQKQKIFRINLLIQFWYQALGQIRNDIKLFKYRDTELHLYREAEDIVPNILIKINFDSVMTSHSSCVTILSTIFVVLTRHYHLSNQTKKTNLTQATIESQDMQVAHAKLFKKTTSPYFSIS